MPERTRRGSQLPHRSTAGLPYQPRRNPAPSSTTSQNVSINAPAQQQIHSSGNQDSIDEAVTDFSHLDYYNFGRAAPVPRPRPPRPPWPPIFPTRQDLTQGLAECIPLSMVSSDSSTICGANTLSTWPVNIPLSGNSALSQRSPLAQILAISMPGTSQVNATYDEAFSDESYDTFENDSLDTPDTLASSTAGDDYTLQPGGSMTGSPGSSSDMIGDLKMAGMSAQFVLICIYLDLVHHGRSELILTNGLYCRSSSYK
jgi:hypothetical protein